VLLPDTSAFVFPPPMPSDDTIFTVPTAASLIDIDHVTFGYDASRTILNDVSLSFARGKVTAILGGSGCGKTTLLRLIGGVYGVNAGTVRFDGEVVDPRNKAQLFKLRRRLGMLFQFGALFTDLTVFENVAFPLREHTNLGDAMIRDIVLMKLNAVGLRGAAPLRISQVSGGMARRVALARAIALDPELLMYDEPFAGLDPISMGVAANLIRTLNDTTGATSLIVSHDVQECFAICDYAYLMSSQGKVVAHGRPEQLNASDDPEVRQFLRGEPDGPVRFHYPARSMADDFGVQP
jgi:phospholipid/cholesterol/gamma-HCH transport system ATP-binding protein